MSVYRYSGVTDQGKDVQGIIDAETPKSAKVKLRQGGIFPVELSEDTTRSPVSSKNTHVGFFPLRSRHSSALPGFTKQCSILLEANIPLLRTLSILIEQLEDQEFRAILSEVRESIKEGQSFGDALSLHPQIFSPMYVHMVRGAEVGGVLSKGLGRLADYLERQAHLKGRLINTLMYPAILAGVGMLILIGLVTFVIPKITVVFSDMQETLPLPTAILLGISSLMNDYGLAISFLVVLGIAGGYWLLSTSKGRFLVGSTYSQIPRIGQYSAFFCFGKICRNFRDSFAKCGPSYGGSAYRKKKY